MNIIDNLIEYLISNSAHSCALFSTLKVICWGAASSTEAVGQLGIPYGAPDSVASCGAASCIPVSTIGYISFSNVNDKIEKIRTARNTSCVVFSTGRSLCFGYSNNGEAGSEGVGSNVNGSGGTALTAKNPIEFMGAEIPNFTLTPGYDHTCLVRCDGGVICFGFNGSGQLGVSAGSSIGSIGDVANEISVTNTIPFNTSNIPPKAPVCQARISTMSESTSKLTGFVSHVTTYFFVIPADVTSWALTSVSAVPKSSTISINDLNEATILTIPARRTTTVI